MKWILKFYKFLILFFVACSSGNEPEKNSETELSSSTQTEVYEQEWQVIEDTLAWELSNFFECEEIKKEIHQEVIKGVKRPDDGFGESVNIKIPWADKIQMADSMTWVVLAKPENVVLKNNHTEGDEYVHYSFRGIEGDIAIFRLDGYEWYEFTFISLQHGTKFRCAGMPRLNSEGDKLISCNGDLTAMFTNNSIQYFRKNSKGEWEERFEQFLSLYEPHDAEWDTDGSIVCGFRLPAYQEGEKPSRYFRLRLKDKTQKI